MNGHTIFDTRRARAEDAADTRPNSANSSRVVAMDQAIAAAAFEARRKEKTLRVESMLRRLNPLNYPPV